MKSCYRDCPRRVATTVRPCCICGEAIAAGTSFYFGGPDQRAHLHCGDAEDCEPDPRDLKAAR